MTLTGTFDQILTYMGFSLGIFPLLAIIGVIKLRLTGKSALKVPGFPVPQVIYLTTGFLILFLAYLERPFESSMGVLTVLTGIPAYLFFKKKSLHAESSKKNH
jgi:basic amino acid/polyamine antiporter, APA family